MQPSYTIFDHTADAGLRIVAPTLPELLEPAARGLYAIIGHLVAGAGQDSVHFNLRGGDAPVLLRDYLDELLVLFDRDTTMATALTVHGFDENRLVVHAETAAVDKKRSALHHEVKAITYHELDIRAIPGGYEATIIVDL